MGNTRDELAADIARQTAALVDELRQRVFEEINRARQGRQKAFRVKMPDSMKLGEEKVIIAEFSGPEHGFTVTSNGRELNFSI